MTQIVNEVSQLPQGWAWTTLSEIALAINPGFPSGKWQRAEGQCIPHLRPMNIDIKGTINLSEVKYVQSQNSKPLIKGDILFNNTNSPKLIGKTAYIKEDTNWAYSNHMTRIKVHSFINPGYVSHYLHHIFLRGFFLSNCIHHVNQASVNSTFLKEKVPIPLAPLEEQARIVSKVEELFSFLDAGTESLHKVQAQLKRYRQAVLKYAFEGKLTEEWRQTHKEQTESKPKILTEGITFDEDSCEEPKGWEFVVLSSITKVSVGHVGPVSKYYTTPDEGISMLSTANISDDGLVRLDEINYVNREFSEKNKSKKIYPGDIIVARHGDSGSAARIPDGFKEAFCLNAVIVRPAELVLPRFLEAVFRFHGNRE